MKLVRRRFHGKKIQPGNDGGCLGFLLLSFLVGAIFGSLFACAAGSGNGLQEYLCEYFLSASRGELRPSFLLVLKECLLWPAIIVVAGFLPVSRLAIPVTFLFRGFFLAYTSSVCFVAMGGAGLVAAAASFWVTALFLLPSLFLIGCEEMRRSVLLPAGKTPSSDKSVRLEVYLPSIGMLVVAAALELTVAPKILLFVCSRIFT